jgi:hypothetical protein
MIGNAFKKGHAAKPAQERRRTNYNMRAHPGRYITAARGKAAVSPTEHLQHLMMDILAETWCEF